MGRRKKKQPKLKQVKKEIEEIELKPVKKDDWEDDLNIINNYINSLENASSSRIDEKDIKVELDNVKREESWPEGLDIFSNYENAIEGQYGNTTQNNSQEQVQNKEEEEEEDIIMNLPLLNKKHFNYLFNNYEIGTWTPDKMKKDYISNRYKQMALSRNVEIRHTHRGPVNALSIDTIENKYHS
ncbi:hypothetical protein PIROE2DRAFT_18820 [Piromyces sp. E2]|nr:hypothetical protein PIROE2DRAFT_18820 [Piromyces sp. E2]|eukprot:OUM56535.1 hypothetical protein PIROE2DRAFT_18820 [Piromyces sp. E2]